jgi:hypothetical protein
MTKIQINDVVRDMTAEEQAEFDARQVTPPTAFEQSMIELRTKRNRLLAETDYYGVSDNTMSSEMETYRTNLRNITNGLTTVEQVEAVTWPTKPGA